jgi:2-haloacid dehalogenase
MTGRSISPHENDFSGVKNCVFDAYGTLFDFTSAAAACQDLIGNDIERLTTLWRDKQLQYTWLRTAQHRHADFWQVTGDALDFALETLGIETAEIRDSLMALYLKLEPFPEVSDTLERLHSAGIQTALLSNGTPHMLTAIVKAAKLERYLDAILSVEQVGVFKPDPRVYQMAADHFRRPASEILFLSSNGWDAYAASAFGMRVLWCNRTRQIRERLPGAPDREISSLVELPALLGIA